MEPSLSLSPGFLHSFALKEAAAPLGQNEAGGAGWGGSKGRNTKSSAGAGMLGAGGSSFGGAGGQSRGKM